MKSQFYNICFFNLLWIVRKVIDLSFYRVATVCSISSIYRFVYFLCVWNMCQIDRNALTEIYHRETKKDRSWMTAINFVHLTNKSAINYHCSMNNIVITSKTRDLDETFQGVICSWLIHTLLSITRKHFFKIF